MKDKMKLDLSKKDKRQIFSLLTSNASTLRREVLQRLFHPESDIDDACKYPSRISINEYKRMFAREGVGKRVVSILPEESWSVEPEVYETEEKDETEFETAWKSLITDFDLFYHLCQADILSGIGKFGVLLLGIDDGLDLSKPVTGINAVTGEEDTTPTTHKLTYLRQFDASAIEIKIKETNKTSPRYGLPKMYSIKFHDDTQSDSSFTTRDVHWTRVIHLADNRENSDVLGIPRMKPVWNRLLDIKKVLGGSAEMFWKGGFPGYSFELTPEAGDAEIDKESVRQEFERYSTGLQRYLALTGLTARSLSPQVADPTAHIEGQMKNVAFTLGIPYRIFLGTEEAQLASAQDIRTWNRRISKRQKNYLTPMVIRPLIKRFMVFGILPKVDKYFIEWPDYSVPTAKEKADIGLVRTQAIAQYVTSGSATLVGEEKFLTLIAGFSTEEAQAILKEVLGRVIDETGETTPPSEKVIK